MPSAGHAGAPETASCRGQIGDAQRARRPEPGESSHPVTALRVQIKRAYDPVEETDGYRVLIDHVWPRGISRERAQLDEWARDLAPSDALRRWFDHDPARFARFRVRYRRELAACPEHIAALRRRSAKAPLTVVYAARDEAHNNAVVLAEVLRER